MRPDRRRHPATGGPGGGSAGGGGGLSAGGGCRWRLAEASRDGRVSERETASAGGGHGACAGGGGADGARAVRAGRDECHGTHTYIYIAASQRRLAYTSHIKLQRTRAECTSGPQGQSVFFRPVTARPRRRQGARRSAESRRAPLGIVQCPSATPTPAATVQTLGVVSWVSLLPLREVR